MRVEVRAVTINDIDTLFDIRDSVKENYLTRDEVAQLGFTPETLKKMLASDCAGWIATVDGIAAGFCVASQLEAKILGLYVRPEFEGRRLGKLLLGKAESWLQQQGVKEAWLETSADPSFRAHDFYKRMGWRLSGKSSNHQVSYKKVL